MSNWTVSDMPPLKAPGYVRMPGRPKKERTREPTEAPKGTRMSKIGTTIRCTKCKQTGHNRSTCERHAATASGSQSVGTPAVTPVGGSHSAMTPHATPIAIMPLSNTLNSCTSSKKRKAPAGPFKSAQVPFPNLTSVLSFDFYGCHNISPIYAEDHQDSCNGKGDYGTWRLS
jgi:alpha-galactosidase